MRRQRSNGFAATPPLLLAQFLNDYALEDFA